MSDRAKGDKKKPTSRSARAGLQFPVGRVHRLLKVRPATGRPACACLLRSRLKSLSYSFVDLV